MSPMTAYMLSVYTKYKSPLGGHANPPTMGPCQGPFLVSFDKPPFRNTVKPYLRDPPFRGLGSTPCKSHSL